MIDERVIAYRNCERRFVAEWLRTLPEGGFEGTTTQLSESLWGFSRVCGAEIRVEPGAYAASWVSRLLPQNWQCYTRRTHTQRLVVIARRP